MLKKTKWLGEVKRFNSEICYLNLKIIPAWKKFAISTQALNFTAILPGGPGRLLKSMTYSKCNSKIIGIGGKGTANINRTECIFEVGHQTNSPFGIYVVLQFSLQ